MKSFSIWSDKTLRWKKVLIDDEDFDKVKKYSWFLGGRDKNTVTHKSPERYLTLSRYILGITDPKVQVDHKDRDRLNNQKENLRVCTNSQNNANKGSAWNNKSGFRGVCFDKFTDNWKASIMVNKKHIHLGRFNSAEKAAKAYDRAALRFFGEFAVLNFPKV